MNNFASFEDFLEKFRDTLSKARKGDLPRSQANSHIKWAIHLCDTVFSRQFESFLKKKGIQDRLKEVNKVVSRALKTIESVSIIEPLSVIEIKYSPKRIQKEKLASMPEIMKKTFALSAQDPDFDLLMSYLSAEDYYKTLQVHWIVSQKA